LKSFFFSARARTTIFDEEDDYSLLLQTIYLKVTFCKTTKSFKQDFLSLGYQKRLTNVQKKGVNESVRQSRQCNSKSAGGSFPLQFHSAVLTLLSANVAWEFGLCVSIELLSRLCLHVHARSFVV